MKPIMHWDLTIRFKSRDQMNKVIKRILKDEIEFDFSVEKELLNVGEQFVLTIHDMPWANNLERLSKYLIKEDCEL